MVDQVMLGLVYIPSPGRVAVSLGSPILLTATSLARNIVFKVLDIDSDGIYTVLLSDFCHYIHTIR